MQYISAEQLFEQMTGPWLFGSFFFSFFFRICRLLKEVLLKEYSEEKRLSYKVELYHSFIYNNGMKRHENPEKNSSDHHIYPRWFRILYAH